MQENLFFKEDMAGARMTDDDDDETSSTQSTIPGEGDVIISTHTTKQCYNLQKTVLAEHLAGSRSGEENHQPSLRLANEMPSRAVLCRMPNNLSQQEPTPNRPRTPCSDHTPRRRGQPNHLVSSQPSGRLQRAQFPEHVFLRSTVRERHEPTW